MLIQDTAPSPIRPAAALQSCGHVGQGGRAASGRTYCDRCIAAHDIGCMLRDGHSRRLPLYLTRDAAGAWTVSNWPGSLIFQVIGTPRRGRHNIASSRYDVAFVGPDRRVWSGVQYGEFTQVVHCRRTARHWTPGKVRAAIRKARGEDRV